MGNGANDISLEELEQLLRDDDEPATPPAEPETEAPVTQPVTEPTGDSDIENTKAFANRLKERTDKAIAEERDNIAKQFGYASYDEMLKSREKKVLEDSGLDPDEVSPVVDKIVEQRLNSDPRMKELELLKQKQVEEFAKKELAELTKLTNGEITDMSQVPQDVIDMWKKTGSLKQSYMSLHGEDLVNKLKNSASRGTTSHLQSPTGATVTQSKTRPLTAEERQVWKFFNPKLTDEELDKKTVDY